MNSENETAKLEEWAHEEMERRFSEADEKYMGMIEEYVAGGFCETLARLAIYLGRERAERAIGKLSEETRAEVERRIEAFGDKTRRTDLEIVLEAGHVLEKAGINSKTMADSVINDAGQKVLAAFYHESDTLFARNPVLATSIEKYTFLFEDIAHIDDRATQKILREVEGVTLAKALRGKNAEAVREKIYQNMSKRAAEMLKEDIEFMGPIPVREVDAAQKEILDIIRRLEECGEIVIVDREEDFI
ncbi:MAG: hypothetical protein HDR51_03760 [Treponema sp.]|nr:hypothetical protein [Treponema sp.]MDE6245435.1 hypothetical protein [Treponemataceae bacterium]